MSDINASPVADTQDLVFTRVFNAPVERVWAAWTDPTLVTRWWGPDRFTSPSAEIDLREGGKSLLCMRAPKEFGGQDFYSTWEYRTIAPMERIEFIHNLSDSTGNAIDPVAIGMPADFPRDQVHELRLKPLEDGKVELTVVEYGWMPGKMMEMSKMGMEQCLEKMAAVVE